MSKRPTYDDKKLIEQAEAIEAAAGEAVMDALRMHKRLGNPIAVWEDEQVKWVPPEETEHQPQGRE